MGPKSVPFFGTEIGQKVVPKGVKKVGPRSRKIGSDRTPRSVSHNPLPEDKIELERSKVLSTHLRLYTIIFHGLSPRALRLPANPHGFKSKP